MSTTEFSFKVRLKIGDQLVPLASEVVLGEKAAQGGVGSGFLFKLDRLPDDPPVTLKLGEIIGFIEQKLGSGSLAQNRDLPLLTQAFPTLGGPSSFDAKNGVEVAIQSFVINSTDQHSLFSISVDVHGVDPTQGLVPLPAELAKWLRIDALAISFTAEKTT